MYNAHDFDVRVPLHRRSLRKEASISAEDAIGTVDRKYDAAEGLEGANKLFNEKREALIQDRMKRLPANMSEERRKRAVDKLTRTVDEQLKAEKAAITPLEKARDAANQSYEVAMDKARMPKGDPAYYGLDKDKVQAKLPKNVTSEQLSRIHSSKLGLGQNLRALGYEAKQLSYTPNAILKRGWENMGEGGGGWAAGNQMGRYLPLGGKAFGGVVAIGDVKDAVNRSDPYGQGRSRTERLGSAVGSTVGGVVGGFSGRTMGRLGSGLGLGAALVGGIGGMMGGGYVGGKAGKGIDSLLNKGNEGDYVQAMRRRGGA